MKSDFLKKAFGQYQRPEFAGWLWRGLQSFHKASTTEERAAAFDNAGRLILQYETVCEGIATIYEEFVPEKKRLQFRQAIGDVLLEKSKDHSDLFEVFQDLIYLIIRLKADEALSALLPTVGNGVLGRRYPDILYETVTAIASLAPSSYAYETALHLIDSSNFDDGYLFEAIKVLVECKPSETAKIVLKLVLRLNQLYKITKEIGGDEYKIFTDAAEDWAEFVLRRGVLSWLPELWEKASHSSDQTWLFNVLFTNKAVPVFFDCDDQQDIFWINYRSKQVPVTVAEKDYNMRRILLAKSATQKISGWINNPEDKTNQTSELSITPISEGIVAKLKNILNPNERLELVPIPAI